MKTPSPTPQLIQEAKKWLSEYGIQPTEEQAKEFSQNLLEYGQQSIKVGVQLGRMIGRLEGMTGEDLTDQLEEAASEAVHAANEKKS